MTKEDFLPVTLKNNFCDLCEDRVDECNNCDVTFTKVLQQIYCDKIGTHVCKLCFNDLPDF